MLSKIMLIMFIKGDIYTYFPDFIAFCRYDADDIDTWNAHDSPQNDGINSLPLPSIGANSG
jgi:hypothetical protein